MEKEVSKIEAVSFEAGLSPAEQEKNLLNKNFVLMIKGQRISFLGSVIYTMALSFWILDMTDSTALMGIVLAAGLLPMILIFRFSGVLAARLERKRIMVLTDLVRWIFVILLSLFAIANNAEVWMIIVVSLVNGICAAFFTPAANSTLQDLVPKSKFHKLAFPDTMTTYRMESKNVTNLR